MSGRNFAVQPEVFQPLSPVLLGRILIAEPDALIRETVSLSLTQEGIATGYVQNPAM